jgi:hypothetical protein
MGPQPAVAWAVDTLLLFLLSAAGAVGAAQGAQVSHWCVWEHVHASAGAAAGQHNAGFQTAGQGKEAMLGFGCMQLCELGAPRLRPQLGLHRLSIVSQKHTIGLLAMLGGRPPGVC